MPFAIAQGSSVEHSVAFTVHGDEFGDSLGSAVSFVDDVNGDGLDDFVVGAPGTDVIGTSSGLVRLFSGADASILFSVYGDSSGEDLGWSVSGISDVSGDGVPDIIVGALGDNLNGFQSGSVFVLSGVDGSRIYTLVGDEERDNLGYTVSAAGDVDGDGVEDFIAGTEAGPRENYARVYSGADGSTLHTFSTGNFSDTDVTVAGAGDVNGDGFADLVVGWPTEAAGAVGTGAVRIYSGLDGSLLYFIPGDATSDGMGIAVDSVGDFNSDGFDDVLVGAFNLLPDTGYARVYSGADGAILDEQIGTDSFARAVAGAGDLNQDGSLDYLVGSWAQDFSGFASGSLFGYSGESGAQILAFDGDTTGDHFGLAVAGGGDINGDGIPDFIAGARNNGLNVGGYARVFVSSGGDGIGTRFCSPAVPSSIGVPATISALGSTDATNNNVTLLAGQLPNFSAGFFLTSQTQGFVPMAGGSQGTLCLGGTIGRYSRPGEVRNSGLSGSFDLAIDLLDTPSPAGAVAIMAGETRSFQAWFRDSVAGSATSNFTDGVAVTFQ